VGDSTTVSATSGLASEARLIATGRSNTLDLPTVSSNFWTSRCSIAPLAAAPGGASSAYVNGTPQIPSTIPSAAMTSRCFIYMLLNILLLVLRPNYLEFDRTP